MVINYAEFVAICRVHNKKNFGGFKVEEEGLYTLLPDDDEHPLQLSPTERAVLSWHPTGIYKNPALPLPCTLEELRSFVADAGLLGCIDEDAITAMLSQAGDTPKAQAAYNETVLNGKAIDWRYWVYLIPALNVMQAACLMSALEPDIFANLNGRPGKADPAKNIDKAKKIQRLAEVQGKLTSSPVEWVKWAQSQTVEVHPGFLLAVEELPKTTGESSDTAAKVEAASDTTRSITKGEVINAFEGLHYNRDQWNKYLGDPPKWLKACRVTRGKQGDNKVSARWNPVLIAVALLDIDKKITTKKLGAVFVNLKDWIEEWQDKSALLSD